MSVPGHVNWPMMNTACRSQEDRSRPAPHQIPETIHLAAGARLVPESLLEPPFSNDRRHVLPEEASVLLNRYLRRLARMHNRSSCASLASSVASSISPSTSISASLA